MGKAEKSTWTRVMGKSWYSCWVTVINKAPIVGADFKIKIFLLRITIQK